MIDRENARKTDVDVLIAGAGPVGLLLANLLGLRGLRVLVAARRAVPPQHSMAIGITPPSLRILKRLDLDRTFVDSGVPIRTARVFENSVPLGTVDFSEIHAEHPYILSLPQIVTTQFLRNRLSSMRSVRLEEGSELIGFSQDRDRVRVTLRNGKDKSVAEIRSWYLVGCDGHRSAVRRLSGMRESVRTYAPRFLMADIVDDTDFGDVAHVYFGAGGAVESFPLPERRRRWIVQTSRALSTHQDIETDVKTWVHQRTGIDLSASPVSSCSAFQPRRARVHRYVCDRVSLCGDAAHVMSPIGGQGMNTGFADAAHLADALDTAIQHSARGRRAFTEYDGVRRKAFTVAANRAARGMWLGTRRGPAASALRHVFIAGVLFRWPVHRHIAPYFAMLTIPGLTGQESPEHRSAHAGGLSG